MLSFRASLAFVFAILLSASPVFARTHRAGSSHSSSSASGKKSTQKSGKTSAQKSTRSSTSSKSGRSASTRSASYTRSRKGKGRVTSHRMHGQQGIDSARATEIQQALIRQHYLSGEPSGQWDSSTQAAMQKYQADQGWQTKLMPDSRALVKLGLGPDYSNAINAKTGNFASPPSDSTLPASTVAGFSAGSGAATDSPLNR